MATRRLLSAPLVPALLAALLPVLTVPVGAAEPQAPTGSLWYRIEIDGAPAGWALERIVREDGRTTTSSHMSLHLRRGGTEVALELASRFVETTDGEPVLLWRRQTLGRLPVESSFRFGPDGVEATTVQAGRESTEILPTPPGDWLTPDAARRATVAHRVAGDERYTLRLIEPLQGLEPVTVTRELLGPATVPGAIGRWRERPIEEGSPGRMAVSGSDPDRPDPPGFTEPEASNAGASSEIQLDAAGRLVASSTTFLGLDLTLRRTDRRNARAAIDSGETPELMVSNFVRPDRPLRAPRRMRRAVYELGLTPGRSPAGASDGPAELPDLPRTDTQRVEPVAGPAEGAARRTARVRVVVDTDGHPRRPPDADGAPAPPDRSLHLAASSYLDHRDPAVRALLEAPERASGQGPDGTGGALEEGPRARAESLAALVHREIAAKNLDTGFATASEVARTRTGDCTEHAVLLAALLRAEGIPSRVVSGLVYLEQLAGARDVFGYHMWTQALIDGRWVDLDATAAPGPESGTERTSAPPGASYGFDATHIALAVSPLDGPDAAADFLPLTPLIGRLEIRVVEGE